jgi:cytochrome c-type biogenesis protein CcmH/NrfG
MTAEQLAASLEARWPVWAPAPTATNKASTTKAPEPDPGPLNDAAALYEAGRLRDARAAIERVLAQTPSPAGWVLLGEVKFDSGDVAGAHAATQQALALDAKFAHAYMLKATLALDAKDDAAAREALERAIALDPAGPDVAEARALLQRSRNN